MQLEVLGLGVGAPLGSGCPSYAVSTDSTLVVLDFGPGALEQAWQRDLLGRIDAVVISHMHMDHVLDLPALFTETVDEAIRSRRPEPLRPEVYVPRGRGPEVLDAITGALDLPSVEAHEYDESDTVEVGDLRLTFALTAHALPALAPRVTDGRKTLVYSADAAYREELVKHAAGADLLLLESTYLEESEQLERAGHMTGEQAGRVAAAAGAGKLVLTHTMPFPEENQENLRRAQAVFAGEVELARRGAVYEV